MSCNRLTLAEYGEGATLGEQRHVSAGEAGGEVDELLDR